MKATKLSLIAVLSICFSTNAFALTVGDTTANSNIALMTKIVKSENIDKLLDRANNLDKYTELYILTTGKLPSTVNDIKNKFGLDNSVIANYSGETLTVTINNYKIIISNLFSSGIDSDTFNILQAEANSNLSSNAQLIANYFNGKYHPAISYTMSPKLIAFMQKISAVPANGIISETAPSDTSKTWYKPTGDGDFKVYKYVGGEWKDIGNMNAEGIVASSVDELNNFNSIAQAGTKAYVKNNNSLDTYVFDGTKWYKVATAGSGSSGSSGSNGTVFQGATEIKNLATNLFNSAVGSVGYVPTPSNYKNDPNYVWTGNKAFFKKEDPTTKKGYWISQQNKYVVFDNVEDAYALRNLFPIGTIAYTVNSNKQVVRLELGANHQWYAFPSSRGDIGNYTEFLNKPYINMIRTYPFSVGAPNADDLAYSTLNPFITLDGKIFANWKEYQSQYPVKYCYIKYVKPIYKGKILGKDIYIYPMKQDWLKEGTKYWYGDKNLNTSSLSNQLYRYQTLYYSIITKTKSGYGGNYPPAPAYTVAQECPYTGGPEIECTFYVAKPMQATCPDHGTRTWYKKQ